MFFLVMDILILVKYMRYINYFFMFSILGHFIEIIFNKGVSGILFGYWTPIYGIGTLIVLGVNNCVNKIKCNRFCKFLTLFLLCSIILSIIEASSGYLIKLFFNKELWNYSNQKFNIGKYTSLKMAFIWGLSSTLFIYFLNPIVNKVILKIPKLISIMCISVFLIDIMTTIFLKII